LIDRTGRGIDKQAGTVSEKVEELVELDRLYPAHFP
jgi:hypothetical protein